MRFKFNKQPSPDAQPSTVQPARKSLIRAEILIVVLIVIAAVGWQLYTSHVNSGKPYHYKYHGLSSYKLDGSVKGTGMSFSKPKELKVVTTSSDKSVVAMWQTKNIKAVTTKNGSIDSVVIAYLGAYSAYNFVGLSLDSYSYPAINSAMTDTSNKDHAKYIEPIKAYLSSQITSRYKLTLGTTKSLVTPNITKWAWTTDFSGVDPKPAYAGQPDHIKGQVVYAMTKKGYYYFHVAAIDYNWDSNQGTMQKVVNSIKLDQ